MKVIFHNVMKNCVTTYLNYYMKFLSLKKKKIFEFCHVGLTKKKKEAIYLSIIKKKNNKQ